MAFQEYYPHLFAPMYAGKHQIRFKNRVFTSPMSSENDPASQVMQDDNVEFYAKRARGGAGCVHVGETRFDKVNSVAHPCQLDLTDPKTLPQLNKFNNYAHTYGARTSLELNHAGHFAIPAFNDGHTPPMSATVRRMPNGNLVREMSEEDMDYVADIYANAIHMAWRGGFDMACLHYGHGWLFGGWLSPLINTRTDGHGGSRENRIKFPRMVLERVRQKMGSNILIELRMSGSEMSPGGIEIEDTIYYIKELEDLADLVHFSAGNRLFPETRAIMHPSHFLEEGHNVHLAAAAKKAGIKIPVGAIGSIQDPAFAERVLAEGQADYILLARAWVADNDWANKARAGKAEDIRPCIKCFRCMDLAGGKRTVSRHNIADYLSEFPTVTRRTECSVNPLHGNAMCKIDFPLPKAKKTVAVVGGGNSAAGDALLLSRIAERVVLVHRRDQLRATKIYHEPLIQAENVEFRWNSTVTELLHEEKLTGIRLRDVQTGAESVLPCDGLFISVGRKPATELVKGQLELDAGGYVTADETTRTNLPGVYAVGDVRTKPLRQVVTAVADGAMAVHMAEEYLAGGA